MFGYRKVIKKQKKNTNKNNFLIFGLIIKKKLIRNLYILNY